MPTDSLMLDMAIFYVLHHTMIRLFWRSTTSEIDVPNKARHDSDLGGPLPTPQIVPKTGYPLLT